MTRLWSYTLQFFGGAALAFAVTWVLHIVARWWGAS